MSNQFKPLDSLFPCGKERHSGEVVTTHIVFQRDGRFLTSIDWKRKAWYVNASVNAFHMHRGLCREFSTENSWVPINRERGVKKTIAKCVMLAYLRNFILNDQAMGFDVDIDTLAVRAKDYVHDASYDMSIDTVLSWSWALAQSQGVGSSASLAKEQILMDPGAMLWELTPFRFCDLNEIFQRVA